MLLVIDNYDSFTYNLVQYLGELGEQIEVRRNDEVTEFAQLGINLTDAHLELNPDDARAWNLGAAILATLGETERALEFARKSVAIDPDDPMLLYNVACTIRAFRIIQSAIPGATLTIVGDGRERRSLTKLVAELGLENVYNARIQIRVLSGDGRIAAYGSVVDMRTQDPTYVPAQ